MSLYSSTMKEQFREALIRHMRQSGIGSAELARRTGVSKALVDKLCQRRTLTPNVHDAVLLAKFFGMSVEQFMGMEEIPVNAKILNYLVKMDPSDVDLVIAQMRGIVAHRKKH